MADLLDLIGGFGNTTVTTLNAPFLDSASTPVAQNVLLLPAYLSLGTNTSTNKKVARYQKGGKVVTAKSALASVETTASLNFEAINKDTLAFLLNSQWVTSSNVVWPALKGPFLVPSGTPEITDTDITAANAASVFVYMDSNAAGTISGPLVPTQAATPASGEFKVNGATNKLTFHTDQIGATIRYKVPKTYSSGRTLLAETGVNNIGAITWEGVVEFATGAQAGMRIHDMSPSGMPSFEFGDGLITAAIEFDCNTPADKPDFFEWIDLDSLVA